MISQFSNTHTHTHTCTHTLQDLGFHVVWVLGWFIASVDWAVGFNNIRSLFNDVLTQQTKICPNIQTTTAPPYTKNPDTFVQASIADVSIVCYVFARPRGGWSLGFHEM